MKDNNSLNGIDLASKKYDYARGIDRQKIGKGMSNLLRLQQTKVRYWHLEYGR